MSTTRQEVREILNWREDWSRWVNPRSQDVMRQYADGDMTMEAISIPLGVTPQRVRQMLRRGIREAHQGREAFRQELAVR